MGSKSLPRLLQIGFGGIKWLKEKNALPTQGGREKETLELMDASRFWDAAVIWVFQENQDDSLKEMSSTGNQTPLVFSGAFPGLTTTLDQRLKSSFQLELEEEFQLVQEFPRAGLAGGVGRLQFATARAEQSLRRSYSTSLLEGDKKQDGGDWT